MIGFKAVIPFDQIEKAEVYINSGKKTMTQIKSEIGCDYILNGGLFNMGSFQPTSYIVKDGQTLCNKGNPYGFAFDENKVLFSYANGVAYPDFIGAYPPLIINGAKAFDSVPAGLEGSRGRSALGITNDSFILRCVPDGKNDYTLSEIANDMLSSGCVHAINLDGGGSSQCVFGNDTIFSSRIVQNFVCIWAKKKAQQGKFQNGAKRTNVYETTACKKKIGSLDPYEVCDLLYSDAGYHVVMYYITGSTERKVGFIRR